MTIIVVIISPLSAAGSSYLPSVERSASPYDSSVRGPRKSSIFGESGGIERFQLAKRVLCASIAERERKLLKQVVDVVDLNNSCYFVLQCHLVYSSLFFFLAADGVGPRNVVETSCLGC